MLEADQLEAVDRRRRIDLNIDSNLDVVVVKSLKTRRNMLSQDMTANQ